MADAIKAWLGVLTIIGAGAYSLFEYVEHKQSIRLERSLGYVRDYRHGSTAEARLSLSQLLAGHQQKLTQLLGQNYQNEAELGNVYKNFILKITDNPEVQRNLEISFSFFEEMTICVERELCDREVVDNFFTNDARALFNSFYPYVCSLRKQWNNDTVYLKLENFFVKPGNDICS